MFCLKYLFYFILLHSIIGDPQVNLYYTDWIGDSENENDTALQHNCLHIPIDNRFGSLNYEVITYCMSELPSKFNVKNNNNFSNFTFAELSKQNISSRDLYLWSTPIDIIERYQHYLNQLSTENDLSLGKQVFYNCTLPRFGPMCQYQLYYYDPHRLSLYKIMEDFYKKYQYDSTNLTCYMHLQCNRGPSPSCLDWSEICDGKVDCLDGQFDEEHCWKLEINQCKDNEYRCINGQCIPQTFFQYEEGPLNCIDGSDVSRRLVSGYQYTCDWSPPSFVCDEITCDSTYLTSSCQFNRRELLLEAMFSMKNESVSEECWSTLKCIFAVLKSELSYCYQFCDENPCVKIIKNTCPDMLYFPNVPILFGHIYLAFKKNNSTIEDIGLLYICYNNSHYDSFFNMTTEVLFNNTRCFLHNTISYSWTWEDLWAKTFNTSLEVLYNQLKQYQLMFNYTSLICKRSNMHQCRNSSKCISIHRLMDGINDCPYMDDENMFQINNTDVIKQLKQTHLKCETSNKYIHMTVVQRRNCDCDYIGYGWCYNETVGYKYENPILFDIICDGFVELTPIVINGQNETDETECEQWECNNKYTNCDKVWNCLSGTDEINCPSRPSSNCSLDDHICVSPQTNQFICLLEEKVNDGRIDCLGAYDEREICQTLSVDHRNRNNFYCMNQTNQLCVTAMELCNDNNDCENKDDERFCTKNRTFLGGVCWSLDSPLLSDVERFLCNHAERQFKTALTPLLTNKINTLDTHITKNIEMSTEYKPHCLRGLDLYVWLDNKRTITCLCPPSYYGSQCQYQNQRISLSIQFRALSDSYRTLFGIIISLIDDSDQRIIHSYVQISYLSVRNCENKFGIYLVYSTRPKDPTKTYSIHIDIYEKESLDYRGSLLFTIDFPFLPVHRLGIIVDIPRKNDKTQGCSQNPCFHGKCIKYSNTREDVTFCQCDKEWSGKFCTIKYTSLCSSDSLSIGISANNQSICVCPMNKFGSRCLLVDPTCSINNSLTCQDHGQCIPDDNYMGFIEKFRCVCEKGYNGDRCQIEDKKLTLSFNKDIDVSQSIFLHFIEVVNSNKRIRSTTFQTIPTKQDSVTIYWSDEFHLAFLELLNKNYYLIVNENIYNRSTTIEKLVNSSDRCPNINELLNKTIVQLDLIRRIKYYHLPCQMYSPSLNCFYDEIHLCLCYNFNKKRLADCFKFDHNMKFDCIGQNECENGGQCFQDSNEDHTSDRTYKCPSRSICKCLSCYYGRRCQFTTSGLDLSLDTILGYQILPDENIENQTIIVKFSLSLTIIFIVIGLIDGIICLITFKNKIICEVGCGLYLFGSSIITLLIMIIFGLKFFILLFSQIRILSNESFLLFQCHSIDFILRICLSMTQWLNACVALERTIVVTKSQNFSKKKSQQAAKFVIIILLIVIIGSYIHDPIYRRLIDEQNDDNDNQTRTWCVVSYSSNLQVYNYIIHILHVFGPFLINLISPIILIIKTSRRQSNLHKKRVYKDILKEQLREHRHLLISPIVLVILTLPRLILTFQSKCMKSANDSWPFLIAYFISFIPSMITSIIFILPSKFYRKECRKTILKYRTYIQQHLHFTRQNKTKLTI